MTAPAPRQGAPRLHVVQRIATPHNNALLAALAETRRVDLRVYYAAAQDAWYNWSADYANAVVPATFIDPSRIDWRFLLHGLTHRDDRYLFVGWPGLTGRAAVAAFALTGRRFAFWSDHPVELERSVAQRLARGLLYRAVGMGADPIFVAGRRTVEFFAARGMPRRKLRDLPIFVPVPGPPGRDDPRRAAVRARYLRRPGDVLFCSGSRLEWRKGFDVLLRACADLLGRDLDGFHLVVVGSGSRRDQLERMSADLGLGEHVTMLDWLEAAEFESLVAAADVYVHSARFDAFGGGTLMAMAAGVAVIGSDMAGAALDRVEDGVNGYLFPAESPALLAQRMARFVRDPALAVRLGDGAYRTACDWAPERGARMVLDALRVP